MKSVLTTPRLAAVPAVGLLLLGFWSAAALGGGDGRSDVTLPTTVLTLPTVSIATTVPTLPTLTTVALTTVSLPTVSTTAGGSTITTPSGTGPASSTVAAAGGSSTNASRASSDASREANAGGTAQAGAPSPTQAHVTQANPGTGSQRRSVTLSRRRGKTRTIVVRLRKPAWIQLVIRGPAPSCREAGRRLLHGRRGLNRIRFGMRLHGRSLEPGAYRVDVYAARTGRRHMIGTVTVRLERNGMLDPAHAVRFACVGAAPFLPPPFLGALIGAPPAFLPPSTGPESKHANGVASARHRHHKLPIIGAIPRLSIPRPPDVTPVPLPGFVGFALIVLGVGGLGLMCVYVVRFVRGSWNP